MLIAFSLTSLSNPLPSQLNRPAICLSSAPSRIVNLRAIGTAKPMDCDLCIAGAGTLGTLVGKAWHERHPEHRILGETLSIRNHEELRKNHIEPVLRSDNLPIRASRVLFSVPPVGDLKTYISDVHRALELWNRSGPFVFISSASVYVENSGGECTEKSEVVKTSSPSISSMLEAEQAVIEAKAVVLRLAGLYTLGRGPHSFWVAGTQEGRKITGSPHGLINLIHYADAASLCVKILEQDNSLFEKAGRIFLGCDNHPISRLEIVQATMGSQYFKNSRTPLFEEVQPESTSGKPEGPLVGVGKRCNNTSTRQILGWEPTYDSFQEYMSLN